MATDAEWERINRGADASGTELSRFIVHKILMPDALPADVLSRAVREVLVLALLEERRLREAGAGEAWEEAGEAIDDWLESEGVLARLTDPGAADRWKAAGDGG